MMHCSTMKMLLSGASLPLLRHLGRQSGHTVTIWTLFEPKIPCEPHTGGVPITPSSLQQVRSISLLFVTEFGPTRETQGTVMCN